MDQARQTLEMALKLSKEVEDYIGLQFSFFWLAWHHRLAGQYALAMQYNRSLYEHLASVADEGNFPLFVQQAGNCATGSVKSIV